MKYSPVIALASLMASPGSYAIDPEVSITAPSSFRAVEGSTLTDLEFGITNLNGSSATVFDLDITAGSTGSLLRIDNTTAPGTPWPNASLDAGASGSLFASPSISGATAGSSVNFGVQANHVSWSSPVSASTQIDVVQNRLLTGSANLNVGRHILGSTPVGSVTLNGGTLTDSEGTRISVHSGGFAQFANGLRLTSNSDFTFNGAGQSHDLQIAYNGASAGSYSLSTTLPGAGQSSYTDVSGAARQDFGGQWISQAEYGNLLGQTAVLNSGVVTNRVETPQPTFAEIRSSGGPVNWELSRGGGPIINERQNPLITGEVIAGSNLDLSGVSLQVTGTAVYDRSITNGTINLGRQMVGTPNETISRSDTITLGTFGSDDTRTRLNLGAFSESNATLTASLGSAADFNSADDTAEVSVTGNFTIDRSVLGQGKQVFDVGSAITGEGLAGESVRGLEVGYVWNNVENNALTVENNLIIDYADRSGSRSYFAGWVDRVHSSDTHTALGFTTNGTTLEGGLQSGLLDSQIYYPENAIYSRVNGTKAVGLTNLGSSVVTAVAEGLAGEDVSGAHATITTHYAGIERADFLVTHNGTLPNGPLTDGDVITVSDQGSGIYQAHTMISDLSLSGSDNLEYELSVSNGFVLNHGQSTGLTVNYVGDNSLPGPGGLSRISKANLTIGFSDLVDYNAIESAWGGTGQVDWSNAGYNFLGEQTFALETRIEAPAAASGSASVASGTDLGFDGLALQNTELNTSGRFGVATSVELLDGTVGGSTTVNIEFLSIDDADVQLVAALESADSNAASLAGMLGVGNGGTGVKFTSEIVNVTGLDGVEHVLQLSYDASTLENPNSLPQMLWQTVYDSGSGPEVVWVHAVLGNSNVTDLNLADGLVTVNGVEMPIATYLESMRFIGSYADYLAAMSLTNPELGAWGVDVDGSVSWAVIDHNSSFTTAVPEPSSSLLVALGTLAVAMRRKRQK